MQGLELRPSHTATLSPASSCDGDLLAPGDGQSPEERDCRQGHNAPLFPFWLILFMIQDAC